LPAGSPSNLRHSTPGYFPIITKKTSDLVEYEDDYFALAILIIDVLAGKELWHDKSSSAIVELLSGDKKVFEEFAYNHLRRVVFRLPMLEKFLIGGFRCDPGFLIGIIALLENSFDVLRYVLKK
jgi:hypothetical protein